MASAAGLARRAARTGAWRSSVAVGVLLGACLLGLTPLLQGFGWWFATMAMVAVLLAVAAVLRGRGVPEVTVVAVSALAWGVIVVVLYALDSLWFVLPTLDTVTDISADLAAARVSIAEQEVPAVADPAITQLLVMSVGLIAIVADALATGLRTPVLAGIGPLAVLAVPALIRRDPPNVLVYLLAAAAFLLVVWCSARIGPRDRLPGDPAPPVVRSARGGGRNPGLAVGVAAAAIAAMVALPVVTPGLTAQSLAENGDGSTFASIYATGVDPTIQLGRDLNRSAPVLSLSYTTTSEEGLYLKLVNLTDFSTPTWLPEDPYDAIGYEGQSFGPPPGLAADVPTTEIDTAVTIAGLRSDWLPLPYPTERVDDLSGSWLLTPSTFTVTDLRGDTRDLDYAVEGLQLNPTADQLAAAGATVPDALRAFLRVPDELDPVVAQTAATVAQGAATNYDRAVALQEYFRSGEFSYTLQAPDASGYEGGNTAMIAAFLQAREGYCVHFSAAMAVMARTLGIPSRIAIGYAPGQTPDRTSEGGRALYEVYTDQLHAWPELYFEGVGWLPFEPTPGLDFTPPDYSLPDYAQSDAGGGLDSSGSTPSSTAAPQERPDTDPGAAGAASAEQLTLAQVRGWGVFAAVLGGLAVIVLGPFTVRRLRRRARVRAIGGDAELPATLAWAELDDTLDDYAVTRSRGDSPAELEQRLAADHAVPEAELARLRAAVDAEQFARPGGADAAQRTRIVDDLTAVLTALEAEATRAERARARLLPRSLLRRRPPAPRPLAADRLP